MKRISSFPIFILLLALSLSGCDTVLGSPTETPGPRTDPQGLPNPIAVEVWLDANEDGVRDPVETPLPGVAVQLIDPNREDPIVDEAVTSANGEGELVGLQDLIPGYNLRVTVPEGYRATTPVDVSMAGVDWRTETVQFGLLETGGE